MHYGYIKPTVGKYGGVSEKQTILREDFFVFPFSKGESLSLISGRSDSCALFWLSSWNTTVSTSNQILRFTNGRANSC